MIKRCSIPVSVILFALSSTIGLQSCGGDGTGFRVDLSDNARLSGINTVSFELDQPFQAGLFDYTSTVSVLTSTITISVSTQDANASITINGEAAAGSTGFDISLSDGANVITIIVTAEDGVTTSAYVVIVIRESMADFVQQAYVKASNSGAADKFGFAVAATEHTLVVGAPAEDDSGAVYVFTQDPAGMWSEQALIKAGNADAGDLFGHAVALSGNTLAVGAPGEDSSATGVDGDETNNDAPLSGAVYLFTRDGAGTWSQQAYVKASNTEAANPQTGSGEDFGRSVALSGDTLVVGTPNEDSDATGIDGDQGDNTAEESGAVYVFQRDAGGVWSQQAYVKASNTDEYDWFGTSVALLGDTMAVGAWGEASNATGVNGDQANNDDKNAGAVYMFTRDAGTWSQQAYIKASNSDYEPQFGWSVALANDMLAVGSIGEGVSGAAFVFVQDAAGAWSQQALIKASTEDDRDEFGWSVALTHNALIVGAVREDSSAMGIGGDEADNTADDAGAAYLFTRDVLGNWTHQAYVKASNTDSGDWFGRSVAVTGDTVIVGANREDSAASGIGGDQSDNSAADAGAVYIFE